MVHMPVGVYKCIWRGEIIDFWRVDRNGVQNEVASDSIKSIGESSFTVMLSDDIPST